ncbi:MAG: hypothetical protein HQK97_07240 [Nitrospirae bacterium]|nr:hypothetical protein [Nitrospirota bacterium]
MVISGWLFGQLAWLLRTYGYGFIFNRDSETDSWHRELLINAICTSLSTPQMSGLRAKAWRLNAQIAHIDQLLIPVINAVCPTCQSVCCVNRFGRYDIGDIIYVAALGIRPDEIIAFGTNERPEDLPCNYLAVTGCAVSRQLRPFRCNWYFCTPAIEYMESSGGRAYRGFNGQFAEIIRLRKELLDEFHAAIKTLSESD